MKLLYIRWIDSTIHTGWKWAPDFEPPDSLVIESIGWVVHEDERSVSIAGHRGEDFNNVQGLMTIPRCAILSQINLAED